jgi:hypothetical protein
MEYFVLSNIQHNNESLKRGDSVTLSDAEAASLIEAGVIQTEPITDQAPAQVATITDAPPSEEAKVGGAVSSSGELGIDTSEQSGAEAEATDVTPGETGFARYFGGGGTQHKPPRDPSADL